MWSFYSQLFTGLPREVWFLCLVTFVQRSGTMVLPFLTLYLTQRQGFSVQEAGVVFVDADPRGKQRAIQRPRGVVLQRVSVRQHREAPHLGQ